LFRTLIILYYSTYDKYLTKLLIVLIMTDK